jgi:hypothetical protein
MAVSSLARHKPTCRQGHNRGVWRCIQIAPTDQVTRVTGAARPVHSTAFSGKSVEEDPYFAELNLFLSLSLSAEPPAA